MFPAMLDHAIRTVYPHLWDRHRGADLPAGPADSKFDMCAREATVLSVQCGPLMSCCNRPAHMSARIRLQTALLLHGGGQGAYDQVLDSRKIPVINMVMATRSRLACDNRKRSAYHFGTENGPRMVSFAAAKIGRALQLASRVDFTKRRYRDCYREMVRRTAALAAAWACVGFCHGALNTDRVSLAGLSVNLANSAFMEGCAACHRFLTTPIMMCDVCGQYALI